MSERILRRTITREQGLLFPGSYDGVLSLREVEDGIKFVKDRFEQTLAAALNLTRVTAPIFVQSDSGVNDHLSGVEQPVRFSLRAMNRDAEIVQSLAKWKRLALAVYGFQHGEGLYTDMNAIRPDERPDNLHSVYVDQWDWERVIRADERSVAFLQCIVRHIYSVIRDTERAVCQRFPRLEPPYLPPEIAFVHSEDLEAQYPHLAPRERENAICRELGAVFVIGIGAPLRNGQPHDARAADYDDWWTETGDGRRGLNGDILVWYPLLDCAMELSSMGIRVDQTSLVRQLEAKGETAKLDLFWHRKLMAGELPLTIGGGIGQSRLCMLFLRRAHVGEVQASIWPEEMLAACQAHGVRLL
ncbi:MAG: aspartate--ammonia ligase [Chloroflexi bacterium]|nr:aspartate--ammonia ligase [Chloroflexota bacterium]